MVTDEDLKKEAEAFDKQTEERIKQGFIPDLRRLKKVEWFYNNMWRDPEFVKIHLMPKVNYVINIAKQKGGKVLELGCGYGYLTLELARNGLDVTGIDLSSKSIEVAKRFAEENPFKENFGSLNYECNNILEMEFGENKFDTIVFFGTLHHLPDIDKILLKVNKALKDGGNLIVCEPIRENLKKEEIQIASILKAILPTYIPYEEKLGKLDNTEEWNKYVDEVYKEYTYQDDHEQSPCDNITSSKDLIVNSIKNQFEVKNIEFSDAFLDKIIGGLRGENKYLIAKFLKFLDDEMIKKNMMQPGGIRIHAVKQINESNIRD
ncbi:methyltransferase domain-containing protein [Candidatus Woesearchaeota archaeon]|jgi:2-polyprenyl-3-methyl-5-hydroxy-6-metoxy-1,4-benzoquinol methylase|nr:methyltransferase domain-containing protein [Candidatus Woesearchaeota archaeon]